MKIVSITVSDETSPVEIQEWLDNNPTATITSVTNDGRIFFIFYQ